MSLGKPGATAEPGKVHAGPEDWKRQCIMALLWRTCAGSLEGNKIYRAYTKISPFPFHNLIASDFGFQSLLMLQLEQKG